jgi:hypothetical protein
MKLDLGEILENEARSWGNLGGNLGKWGMDAWRKQRTCYFDKQKIMIFHKHSEVLLTTELGKYF